MTVRYRMISVSELSSEQIEEWRKIQKTNPLYASPVFTPEFTIIQARHRKDIRIGLIEENQKSVGFFTFVKCAFGIARGMPMCDYQGVLVAPNVQWDLARLFEACSIKIWDYEHLIDTHHALVNKELLRKTKALSIDLEGGYEAYQNDFACEHPTRFKNINHLTRKLARDHGELKISFHEPEGSFLDELLTWKSEKYPELLKMDPANKEILKEIIMTGGAFFKGVLTTLRAGNNLVAAHLGMATPEVFHYWFPGYNPAFRKYYPGFILLLGMIQKCAEQGMMLFDLGAGNQDYKQWLHNNARETAMGSYELRSFLGTLRNMRRGSRKTLEGMPFLFQTLKRIKNKIT